MVSIVPSSPPSTPLIDPQTPTTSQILDEIMTRLRQARAVQIIGHVRPDGDCIGSMLALHHVLLANGYDSVASFSEPFVVAPHYRELPGLDLLTKPEDFPAEPDVMVTFDCGSLSRLGSLEGAARGLIVSQYVRVHPVQVHLLESVAAHQVDRLGSQPPAACARVADDDA